MELLLGFAAMYVAYKLFGSVSPESWRRDPATKKQLDYLRDLGVDIPDRELTKGEASDLITQVTEDEPAEAARVERSTKGAEAIGYAAGHAMRNRKFWFWAICLALIILHFLNGGR